MRALIVIDIQAGLTKKKIFNCGLFFETVSSALRKSRENGDLVVFVQHSNNQLIEETADWEIDDRLDVRDGDLRIRKKHGNAFEKTDLKAILLQKGIRDILACGMVTHGCVKATCLGGLEEGFRVSLIENGHTNWNRDAGKKISETESLLKSKGVGAVNIRDLP